MTKNASLFFQIYSHLSCDPSRISWMSLEENIEEETIVSSYRRNYKAQVSWVWTTTTKKWTQIHFIELIRITFKSFMDSLVPRMECNITDAILTKWVEPILEIFTRNRYLFPRFVQLILLDKSSQPSFQHSTSLSFALNIAPYFLCDFCYVHQPSP